MNPSRSLPSPSHRPVSFVLLAALASLVALAPAAHAGLGDLVQKAKDKAAKTVAGKPAASGSSASASGGPEEIEFTDVLLELNGERIDLVLAGLKAGDQVLAGRAALVTKHSKLQDEAGGLVNQHGPAMDAAREKHHAADRCWREALEEKADARQQQMQQRMMSEPALRERVMAMSLEMAQAQAQGDTATVRRLQHDLLAMSAPTKADSLAARQKCGAVPPLHPMDLKVESLQREAAAVQKQIRDNDQKSIDAQVAASGLTEAQFAMARERLLMWYSSARSKGAVRGFNATELAAIEARRPALETALQAWAP